MGPLGVHSKKFIDVVFNLLLCIKIPQMASNEEFRGSEGAFVTPK